MGTWILFIILMAPNGYSSVSTQNFHNPRACVSASFNAARAVEQPRGGSGTFQFPRIITYCQEDSEEARVLPPSEYETP